MSYLLFSLFVIAMTILYICLRRAIHHTKVMRFSTSTEDYTEVYEDGILVAKFDNK